MRRRVLTAAALAALLLLAGCGRKSRDRQDEPMTLRDPRSAVTFTGTEEEDGTLRGTFVSADGWRFEGTAVSRRLTEGAAEDIPCEPIFAETALPGRWTGPWADGGPAGEGAFLPDAGGAFTGSADASGLLDGQGGGLPLELTWCGSVYAGTYTGSVAAGSPEGPGTFEGVNGAGQTLFWDGGWAAGTMAGEGTLRADRLLTRREGREIAGTYEGAGADGLPEGRGVFASVDAEGVPFVYTGAWSAGLMDGPGELRFDAEDRYVRRGTFTAGAFTPAWVEAMESLGTCEPLFTLTEAQKEFLSEYPALWEAETHQTYFDSPCAQIYDSTLSLAKCFSAPEELERPRWMRIQSLRLIRADTAPLFEGGPEVTRLTAADSLYNYVVRVLLPERVDGLARGRRFHVYALPVALSEYTTVQGRRQPCLVLIAADIYIGQP